MKKLLLASILFIPMNAHSEVAVIDTANLHEMYTTVKQGADTLQQIKQVYDVTKGTLDAVAHGCVTCAVAPALHFAGLEDATPVVNAIPGLVSGKASMGQISGFANMTGQYLNLDKGDPSGAVGNYKNDAQGIGNIQGMVADMQQSIKARLFAMHEIETAAGTTMDVKAAQDLSNRIGIEQNMITAQVGQAQSLQTLLMAQEAANKARDEGNYQTSLQNSIDKFAEASTVIRP